MQRTTKHLTSSGNSLALVLEKGVLEATGITKETPLEVSTKGDVILISPRRDPERAERLKQVTDQMLARYAGAFRRLAE